MENKIPIPTDNIYKFYALFGLVLFIFGIGSIIYIQSSTNEIGFQASIEIAAINQIEKPSNVDSVKRSFLQRRIDVALQDRIFFNWSTGIIIGAALVLMIYGFRKWHKEIQPMQDKILELQLKKLQHEVHLLKPHVPEKKS